MVYHAFNDPELETAEQKLTKAGEKALRFLKETQNGRTLLGREHLQPLIDELEAALFPYNGG